MFFNSHENNLNRLENMTWTALINGNQIAKLVKYE